MKKRSFISVLLFTGILTIGVYAEKFSKEQKHTERLESVALSLPDSVFEDVTMEDLIDDEVYLKLAHDGWTAKEISLIMNTAVKDKAKARLKGGYGFYAKQWRPYFGRAIGNDSLYQYVDTTLTAAMIASIEETVAPYDLNTSWDKIPYTPADRRNKIRNPGYFRPVELNPSSGRIHHIVVNPNTADSLYVVADGTGIFSTGDCGDSWTCITDRIPDRVNRSVSQGYGIPVDPNNWSHVFAFMDNSSVYETLDGGRSWRRIQCATHKNFKRGYCFRDKSGKLKFIGATMASNRMYNELFISEDTCKNWTKVTSYDNLKETNNDGVTGLWFQEIYFDPSNRDRIILPGSKSILYFDDGATKDSEGSYCLKRMVFDLVDDDGNVVSSKQEIFPFPGDCPGHMAIDPNDSRRMWYALARRDVNKTALFFTEDGGLSWKTLHNDLPTNGTDPIGKGSLYGNEAAHSWLGGFGVNFKNPDLMYGCSMSSAKSADGGRTWKEFPWGTRLKSKVRDEQGVLGSAFYEVSASRHNADNHTIVSHKDGRVFRGSDGGMFMIDPSVNGGEWTNIGSNMGQMLFYDVRTNEFGDQVIIGNTQDIDVQTYRYGRWGNWRGYEGTEASLNPFSGAEYFSGGGGGGLDGMDFDSWHTARNFADVRTGSWYMLRTWNGGSHPGTLFRIDDIGGSVKDLYSGIQATIAGFALARDNDRTTIYVTTNNGYFYKSIDNGETFQPLIINNVTAKFSSTKLTVDPNDSRYIYLGQNGGKVFKWDTETGKFPAMNDGLPNITCDRLIFHEGSGDLYYVSYSGGIYILEKGATKWRFWTKGYNSNKIRDCDINYTTQELVIADYGRGVWVADLEHPSDRYFSDGFKLRQLSNVGSKRTLGIDTEWIIPLYYNYEWTVNGTKIDNPYQYLVGNLNPGDQVRLTLTLRESPDVSTISDIFTVPSDSEPLAIERQSGHALYSDGSGRMDFGWMDWFFKDFTVDFWLRPESDGVILANRQREADPDRKGAKGWLLGIEGGRLKFQYSPTNYFIQPTYEPKVEQTVTLDAGPLAVGQWQHIAVAQERSGEIVIYVNGQPAARAQRVRSDHSLNNSVCLSLFGDINERNCLRGSIDELKIWNRALPVEEIRVQRHFSDVDSEGLVAYYNFNAESPDKEREIFSTYTPVSRIKAVPEFRKMTVPVSADYVVNSIVYSEKVVFADGDVTFMEVEAASADPFSAYLFAFNSDRWDDPEDNLDPKYFTPASVGFYIEAYDTLKPDVKADVYFHNALGKEFDSKKVYRLYVAEPGSDKTYWKPYGENLKSAEGKILLQDVLLRDLVGKHLLPVELNPALELAIDGLNADGDIEIFEEGHDSFSLTLSPIAGQDIPTGTYSLSSDNGILVTPDDLQFQSGKATGQLRVATEYLGDFNNRIAAVISGETEDMIPVEVDVVNRITPHELGNSTSISKGGLTVGSGADFALLYGSNHITMMGWVRIDNEEVITKGRNNDMIAPLIFFRGGNGTATGLHLRNGGTLSYHWNDEASSYGTAANVGVTTADVGKWVHYALVAREKSVDLYLNGTKYTKSVTVSPSKVASPLLLGQNAEGNTWFSGAFDHVAVWSRSLSDEEVRKYMQERVLLNDEGLVSYITMDHFDENGRIYDLKSGALVKELGSVSKNQLSTTPFNPDERARIADNKYIKLSAARAGTLSVFNGSPYNYLSDDNRSKYYPLNQEFYTLIFDGVSTNYSTQLTYSHPSIQAGDQIVLAIRNLGDPEPFSTFVEASTDSRGSISFSVPAGKLDKSSEIVFLLNLKEDNARRPLIVNVADKSVHDGDMKMLTSTSSSDFNLVFDVESSNAEDKLELSVVEENYASLSNKAISLEKSQGEVSTIVRVDPSKLDRFALNPVTININTNVEGATVDPIKFYVYLQPHVQLSLANGENGSPRQFTATSPYPVLDIEAKLIEGYLTEDVKLKFTPSELGHSVNLASGSLLLGQDATPRSLDFFEPSDQGGLDGGWNLIGNPFLSNINLTKHQNMEYDSNLVTHYIYHLLPGGDNFIAYDMTSFRQDQQVLPFQSFFVQAMDANASFTVKEEAKEIALNRKTFDYFSASEVKTLELALMVDGQEVDRTTIQWSDDGVAAFRIDEDAPKMWARKEGVNTFYTLSESIVGRTPQEDAGGPAPLGKGVRKDIDPDNKPLSFNVIHANTQKVDLVFDTRPEASDISIVPVSMTGFSDDDVLFFNDMSRFRRSTLSEGQSYAVEYPDNKHTISIEDMSPTAIHDANGSRPDYRIYTSQDECTVTGLQGDAEVVIFNLAGLPVVRQHVVGSDTYTTRIPNDIYIVRIFENGKEFVSKIVVK